jgi:cysteine-rich repeat protein
VISFAVIAFAATTVLAHIQQFDVGGKKLLIKTEPASPTRKFLFKAAKDVTIVPTHDPATDGATILVRGITCQTASVGEVCSESSRTPLIDLDPSMWKGLGNPAGIKGYTYKDKNGTRGGISRIIWKHEKLIVKASGDNFEFVPTEAQDAVWVHISFEDEQYCAEFSAATGAQVRKNEAGSVQFKDAPAPGACPEVCGNGVLETGEECDDGNLQNNDGCDNDCTIGSCIGGTGYDSTFEAIQDVIFNGYGCTQGFCHGYDPGEGNLDLQTPAAYDSLINITSTASISGMKRVLPGEPEQSFLYAKLLWGTDPTMPADGGSPMPAGGAPALTADHLEALEKWIRGGAPEDLVVEGTAELLGGCLPDPDPLIIPPPAPPGAGVGFQVWQTPWPLPQQSEDEICMATYYNLAATNLVPASAKVPCPSRFLNANNPSGECFAWHRQALSQDPQSHHSIIHIYNGAYPPSNSGWGNWTLKFQDDSNPLHGDPCNPTSVDPATGYNPDCSGTVVSSFACLGYGAPDFGGGIGSGSSETISGSQEPYYEQELADGVYSIMPMGGILVWNSHAFNLTSTDSSMSQYLNMDFATAPDQLYPAEAIFDVSAIFVANVPPYQTREYCNTVTLPRYARVFHLSSHTHRFGVQWRIWGPPNSSCAPGPGCVPRGDQPIYLSTQYNDPLQLYFDPPVQLDSSSTSNRRYLYCSLYDNGSTPTSPPLRRQSVNPAGGPGCTNSVVECYLEHPIAPGDPRLGLKCNGSDSACDSSPGAGDGVCDACPAVGGVTTEHEMFIQLGTYYRP